MLHKNKLLEFIKGTRFQTMNILNIRIKKIKTMSFLIHTSGYKIPISIGVDITVEWKEARFFTEGYKMITSFNFCI